MQRFAFLASVVALFLVADCLVAEERSSAAYRAFALEHVGNVQAGERLFLENAKTVCSDCHRITGMEKSGPNLDGIGEKYSRFSDEFLREGERFTDPLFAYAHGLGFSVIGGYVYRGDPSSSYYGVYIFGDYNTRRIWGLRQKNGELFDVKELGTAPTDVASFGVDYAGEILLISYGGEIFHLDLSQSNYE